VKKKGRICVENRGDQDIPGPRKGGREPGRSEGKSLLEKGGDVNVGGSIRGEGSRYLLQKRSERDAERKQKSLGAGRGGKTVEGANPRSAAGILKPERQTPE